MKFSTLKLALSTAMMKPDLSSDDKKTLLSAYDELMETVNQLGRYDHDPLDEWAAIVSWHDLTDMLNETTYDQFGRLAKQYCKLWSDRPDTDDARLTTIRAYGQSIIDNDSPYNSVSRSLAEGAATFFWDLWIDNEDNGSHDEDGAFKDSYKNALAKIVLADKQRVDRDLGESHWDGYFDRYSLTEDERWAIRRVIDKENDNG
jgi:hypothetical protein